MRTSSGSSRYHLKPSYLVFLNKKSSLCSGEIFFLLFTHINYQFLFVKNLTFFFAKFTIIIVWATQILFNLFKVLCYSMFFLIFAWLLHRSNEGAFKFDICSLDRHNHIYALVTAIFFFFTPLRFLQNPMHRI